MPADATIEKLTTHPGHARLIAQQTSNAYQRIIAIGGDGTFSEVASGILTSPPPHPQLGVMPLGTGNDFARAVGIDSPSAALNALLNHDERRVDVIEVTCLNPESSETTVHHALLFATIGITSALLQHTTRGVKRLFGEKLAYVMGLLRALPSFQPVHLHIDIDGKTTSGHYVLLGASNAPTAGGGMRLAPGARVDDGLMNINLIEAVSRLEILRHIHHLRRGTHVGHPRVRYCTAREITVNADPPATVQIDGDIVGITPARFRILPAALSLCAPASPQPKA